MLFSYTVDSMPGIMVRVIAYVVGVQIGRQMLDRNSHVNKQMVFLLYELVEYAEFGHTSEQRNDCIQGMDKHTWLCSHVYS